MKANTPNTYDLATAIAYINNNENLKAVNLIQGYLAEYKDQATPWTYFYLCSALRNLSRFAEAEIISTELNTHWPQEWLGCASSALNATQQKNWELAAYLWRNCISKFSGKAVIWWFVHFNQALLSMNNYVESNAICLDMQLRWPNDSTGWSCMAKNAQNSKKWRMAVDAWTHAAKLADNKLAAQYLYKSISILITRGRFYEAKSQINKLEELVKNEPYCSIATLDLLIAQGNYPLAFEFINNNVTNSHLCTAYTPEKLADFLYQYGLSQNQAEEKLILWFPDSDVRSITSIYYDKSTKSNKEVEKHLSNFEIFHFDKTDVLNNKILAKSVLRMYLKNRLYSNLESILAVLMIGANEKQIKKLEKIISRLYPDSRAYFLFKRYNVSLRQICTQDVNFCVRCNKR